VREALSAGRLKDGGDVEVRMTLESAALGMRHVVTGRIDVG